MFFFFSFKELNSSRKLLKKNGEVIWKKTTLMKLQIEIFSSNVNIFSIQFTNQLKLQKKNDTNAMIHIYYLFLVDYLN